MASDPRIPRNIMVPQPEELFRVFSAETAKAFLELFEAVNGGEQGTDRIYELETGEGSGGTLLTDFLGSVDANGILDIAGGGTGSGTAADARANLGLEIGADVLAFDSNLNTFVNVFDLPSAVATPGTVLRMSTSSVIGFTGYTFPATDGSNGQVLSTNGAGALSFSGQREAVGIAFGDETTAITVGVGKTTFRMPFALTLTAVRASLSVPSTTGAVTFDINEGGTSILSTKLSIDAGEKTSTTAATSAVISDTSLADDAEITIDIDDAGSSGDAAGPKIWLIGVRS